MNRNSLFTHFVFTRFNLTNTDPKNTNAGLTPEWMNKRLDLFQRYTLPCLASQKNTNFRWLVFFDTKTSDEYRNWIQELSQKHPIFEPLFIDGIDSLPEATKRVFNDVETPYVISSRIDNDDCVSDEYIEVIQGHFVEQHRTLIDLIDGFQMQVSPSFKIGKKRKPFNPFISLVEETKKAGGILVKFHGQWKTEDRLVRVSGFYTWMAVIHQGNIANRFKAFGKVELTTLRTHYHFDKALLNEAESSDDSLFQSPIKSAYHYVNDYQKDIVKHAERGVKRWFLKLCAR